MLKKSMWGAMALVAPAMHRRVSERRWLRQHALELKEHLQTAGSLDERVDLARSHSHIRSNQKRGEITPLLERVAGLHPRRIGEIGADKGGTLALFASVAREDARLLSLDICYPGTCAAVYPTLARAGQQIRCLEADSHSPMALAEVKRWLAGETFDFLFIDGDHSYEGVKADYGTYGPLVRPGGIIAFHDIVPDFWTRYGKKTASNVGEVPRFWSELKETVDEWEELIEDPEQDGYGIGVVRVRS